MSTDKKGLLPISVDLKPARPRANCLNLTLQAFALAVLISASPWAARAGDDTIFTTIDFPGAVGTAVWGITSVGDDVAGVYYDGVTDHGFKMSSDGQFTSIDVPFEGSSLTACRGINRGGDIVGRAVIMGVEHGWLLSGGVFYQIDFPGARSTAVYGINDIDSMGGGYVGADGRTHAFVRNGVFFTAWDFPDAIYTNVRNLNNGGDVVGRLDTTDQAMHGYLLSGGKFVPIDIPGARTTITGAINSAGDIVGRYISPDGEQHGFLRRGEEFMIIDVPGAALTDATGIDEAGTIVGYYQDPEGHMLCPAVCNHGFRMMVGTSRPH